MERLSKNCKVIIWKKILVILVFYMLLLSVTLTFADEDHNEIEEGKKLVESKIGCDKLNNEQLEAIGEYFMEQMHPGVFHEAMHKMMGIEEGTEYHKRFHINIAKRMYCGEGGMMGSWWYGYWNFTDILYVTLLFGLIVLVSLWIVKLLRGTEKDDKATMIIIILLALLLLFSFGWRFGPMGGMMFFGPVSMILVLVLIVWLVVSLTQGGRK